MARRKGSTSWTKQLTAARHHLRRRVADGKVEPGQLQEWEGLCRELDHYLATGDLVLIRRTVAKIATMFVRSE